MNITVEKQPKCLASLTAEVPADKVASERTSIIGAYSRNAKIKGYRAGKVPQQVIEQRFQKEIQGELEQRLVRAACDEAIEKEDLRVIDVQQPQTLDFAADGTLKFQTNIILVPEITVPEYKAIEVKVPQEDPTTEEFDRAILNLRQRFAEHVDVADRALVENDIAVIDFTSTLDGKTLEEAIGKPVGYLSGREDFWVRLEEDSFLPGFYKQLVSLKAGDQKDISQEIPENFPVADLRGKTVVFAVTVKGIKEQQLPEVNKEFVDKILPGEDVEDLNTALMEQLSSDKKRQIADNKVQQIVSALIKDASFELPDALVQSEANGQANQLYRQGLQNGMSGDDLKSQMEQIMETAKARAEESLRSNFILQKIAEAEKIDVSQNDLLERIQFMAQQARTPVKKYIKQIQDNNQIQSIRLSVLIGKTIDFLVDQAKVTVLSEEDIKKLNEQSA